MKTIILTIALSLTALFLNAQIENDTIARGTTIHVSVALKSDAGQVLFGLHNESTFMKIPLEALKSDIIEGKAEVTFLDVLPGIYGILVFHDKNNNERMDFDETGMPLESYGASNNVMNYGPPMWSDAKFEVGSDPIEMEIRL
jgi:uncharacterized protein (DUF2141 family)